MRSIPTVRSDPKFPEVTYRYLNVHKNREG